MRRAHKTIVSLTNVSHKCGILLSVRQWSHASGAWDTISYLRCRWLDYHISYSEKLVGCFSLEEIEALVARHVVVFAQALGIQFIVWILKAIPSSLFKLYILEVLALSSYVIYGLFGLKGREGEYSRVDMNWSKMSLFSANYFPHPSTLPPSLPSFSIQIGFIECF